MSCADHDEISAVMVNNEPPRTGYISYLNLSVMQVNRVNQSCRRPLTCWHWNLLDGVEHNG